MARNFKDWLSTFQLYASHMEAPKEMHYFAGVSAIAGALRRKVWIDQFYFKWFPNFYVIFVAPPGVVTKSTTVDVALSILRDVPGIKFGPDVVTWQSLVTSFAAASESFEYEGDFHPMSAMTLVSSELGNLINMLDKDMVNLFIDLWDGRKKLDKQTKMSGNDIVEAPWINMIGCTTPHWIADNMPAAVVGGGFTSRCLFVYADRKEKFVAYPGDNVPPGISEMRYKLLQDLEHISVSITGEYTMTREAKEWGDDWYQSIWREELGPTEAEGYRARKQTHVHKLAMIVAASEKDEREITRANLQLANIMIEGLERDMHKVFSRIGRTEESLAAEKFIEILRRAGPTRYEAAYRLVHSAFPNYKAFEDMLMGTVRSGQVSMVMDPHGMVLTALDGPGIYTPDAGRIYATEPTL